MAVGGAFTVKNEIVSSKKVNVPVIVGVVVAGIAFVSAVVGTAFYMFRRISRGRGGNKSGELPVSSTGNAQRSARVLRLQVNLEYDAWQNSISHIVLRTR